MTFPIVPDHQLGYVIAVVIGFGFGFVLERAGFGRANKLAAQFYGHDMTVFKVMFSSIVTALLGVVIAAALGLTEFKALADQAASSTFLVPMIAGGLLLGVGFILSGYCPGTSFVAMASGKIDGVLTVVGVIAGQVLWAELEWRPGFSTFHNAGNLGNYYLWELFHLPARAGAPIMAVAVTVMAVACFVGAEKLEKALAARADPAATAMPGGRPGRFVFAGFATAAVLGVVALALPSGTQARTRDVTRIAALDLARRVFDEPWKVRVLDLRPLPECSAKRVPGAECVPLETLASLQLEDASPSRDIVLVARGDVTELPAGAGGFSGRTFALEGGWKAWEELALAPPAPLQPGAPESAIEAYRLRAGIHAAMTGMKAAPPPAARMVGGAAPRKASGGGCSG